MVIVTDNHQDWIIELRDWATGEPYGELTGADNIKIETGIRTNSAFSCDLPMSADHSLRDVIDEDRLLISATRYSPNDESRTLRFCGPVIAKTKRSNQGVSTLGIAAVGPWWRLNLRVADNEAGDGLTKTGLTIPLADRAAVAAQLVEWTNDLKGTSWIRFDSEAWCGNSWGVENWGGMLTIDEAINTLSDTASGFEWALVPEIGTDEHGLYLARVIAAPALGVNRSDTVLFDWTEGTGNCASVEINEELDVANIVHHAGADLDPYCVTSAPQPSSVGRFGVMEVVEDAPLIDEDLREDFVAAHVAIRNGMRKFITLQPDRSDSFAGNAKKIPWESYDLGDLVGVYAEWAGRVDVDGAVRVYGITVEVDATGAEKVTLELGQD